jgi:hypothetical protein
MTFLLPLELVAPEMRESLEFAVKGARASGTPFVSFFTPGGDAGAGARDAGFAEARHVPLGMLAERYFGGRTDELRPASSEELAGGEELDTEVLTGWGSDAPALLRYAPGLAAETAPFGQPLWVDSGPS